MFNVLGRNLLVLLEVCGQSNQRSSAYSACQGKEKRPEAHIPAFHGNFESSDSNLACPAGSDSNRASYLGYILLCLLSTARFGVCLIRLQASQTLNQKEPSSIVNIGKPYWTNLICLQIPNPRNPEIPQKLPRAHKPINPKP